MTDLQQTRELGPQEKAKAVRARVRQLGAAEVGETALLCAIFDLHERLSRLERLAAQQGRSTTDAESSC